MYVDERRAVSVWLKEEWLMLFSDAQAYSIPEAEQIDFVIS